MNWKGEEQSACPPDWVTDKDYTVYCTLCDTTKDVAVVFAKMIEEHGGWTDIYPIPNQDGIYCDAVIVSEKVWALVLLKYPNVKEISTG